MKQLFELPASIPGGVLVEFFADSECTTIVPLSVTEGSPGRSSLVMPRSTLPALYGPDGVRQVFARWLQPGQVGGVARDVQSVRRCRETSRPAVSGRW